MNCITLIVLMNSRYLSVEILGSAYEQFLGKLIRITPGPPCQNRGKARSAQGGGVYYTPQYIVEYIVKNTVRQTR